MFKGDSVELLRPEKPDDIRPSRRQVTKLCRIEASERQSQKADEVSCEASATDGGSVSKSYLYPNLPPNAHIMESAPHSVPDDQMMLTIRNMMLDQRREMNRESLPELSAQVVLDAQNEEEAALATGQLVVFQDRAETIVKTVGKPVPTPIRYALVPIRATASILKPALYCRIRRAIVRAALGGIVAAGTGIRR